MSAGYLFDTNVLSHLFAQKPSVVARFSALPQGAIYRVSAVTLAEIDYGHRKNNHPSDPAKRAAFEAWVIATFPSPPNPLPITKHTCEPYSKIRAALFVKFAPKSQRAKRPEACHDRNTATDLGIDENDLWIAASAVEHKLVLVTSDEMVRIRDVCHPSDLTVEDWT